MKKTSKNNIIFGGLTISALLAFEIFNYSTTEYALNGLLGGVTLWPTILAIAFCGIDFAGIARLFMPKQDKNDTKIWYLFGAWLLAATLNASLTWWGVSIALANSKLPEWITIYHKEVPIFIAGLVWLIRILIIGTFSVAGDRLFSGGNQKKLVK